MQAQMKRFAIDKCDWQRKQRKITLGRIDVLQRKHSTMQGYHSCPWDGDVQPAATNSSMMRPLTQNGHEKTYRLWITSGVFWKLEFIQNVCPFALVLHQGVNIMTVLLDESGPKTWNVSPNTDVRGEVVWKGTRERVVAIDDAVVEVMKGKRRWWCRRQPVGEWWPATGESWCIEPGVGRKSVLRTPSRLSNGVQATIKESGQADNQKKYVMMLGRRRSRITLRSWEVSLCWTMSAIGIGRSPWALKETAMH
jgi:hypothetical protein